MSVKKLSWLVDLEKQLNKNYVLPEEIQADGWATLQEICAQLKARLKLTRDGAKYRMQQLVEAGEFETKLVRLRKTGDSPVRLTRVYRPAP